MKIRTVIRLAALLGSLLVTAQSAHANTTFFTPRSGAGFLATDNSPNINYSSGIVANLGSSNEFLDASLGFANGGTNGFHVYGRGNGGNLMCTVYCARNSGSGGYWAYSAQTSANGAFNLFIETTPPNYDSLGQLEKIFYTIECEIPGTSPAIAEIYGVAPDH